VPITGHNGPVRSVTDPPPSKRPGPLWAIAALAALVAVAAFVLGTYGDRTSKPRAPATVMSDPAADFPISDLPGPDQVMAAGAFWMAIGAGDLTAVMEALDPAIGTSLSHYAGFATAFRSGLEAEGCRPVSPGAVRCTLHAADPGLTALYYARSGATGYVTSATVTFSDNGIDSFEMPGLLISAAARLTAFARETTGIPEPCDRVAYDSLDLPPFSTTIAQTGACGSALRNLLADALEVLGH